MFFFEGMCTCHRCHLSFHCFPRSVTSFCIQYSVYLPIRSRSIIDIQDFSFVSRIMAAHSGVGSSVVASSFTTSINDNSPYDFLSERYSSQPTQSSSPQYAYRTQSEFFCTDPGRYQADHLNRLLNSDVHKRVTYVGENISSHLFPDRAFGFVLNVEFQEAFINTFLADDATFDMKNFTSGEAQCASFLNRTISTVSSFIRATDEPSLKDFRPRRYFVPCQDTPVKGSTILRKPDLMLVRLVDGCTRSKSMSWIDVQSLAETTRENLPPMRMKETMFAKNYLTFCSQPERDFLTNLSFTGSGFFISVIDHSGTMETNPISFQQQPNTLVFLRMVLGLAFLPDEYLGVDTTISCRETGVSSGKKFETIFPPLRTDFPDASVIACPTKPKVTPTPLPTAEASATGRDNPRIVSISVGQTAYRVISVLFEAKTLIGRATKAFLVELPDGRIGVLKDSWIVISMRSEAELLDGYCIPFCPEVIDHCVLRNTSSLRFGRHKEAEIIEHREKRRIVVYPAGVHISDFSCLWELMAAFMDVVIGMYFPEFFSFLIFPQVSCVLSQSRQFIETFRIQMFFFEHRDRIPKRRRNGGQRSRRRLVCLRSRTCGRSTPVERDCSSTSITHRD